MITTVNVVQSDTHDEEDKIHNKGRQETILSGFCYFIEKNTKLPPQKKTEKKRKKNKNDPYKASDSNYFKVCLANCKVSFGM